jgi:GxxExxY protein
MPFEPIPEQTERVATLVIGAAIAVHRELGPGFLERIYLEAISLELHSLGIPFQRECAVAVTYRGIAIPGQRVDLIVGERVIVELKAVTKVDPIHQAKVISYLRTTGLRLGLILNFNAVTLKDGIRRVVL